MLEVNDTKKGRSQGERFVQTKAGKRILVIEDDEALRQSLAEQLQLHEEFEVDEAADGAEALRAVKQGRHDLILLDVHLPDMDGREVCKLIRRLGVLTPVIMLTGADSEVDTIFGLDSGANDYVTKPFKLGVLLARIRSQLRQHEQSEDAVFTIGPYRFQPSLRQLQGDGQTIRLTDKEAAILKYLCRVGKKVVSRDVLLSEVWGYNASVTTHTLETHIYRLRQKIEQDPANATLLVTEAGGYCLNT